MAKDRIETELRADSAQLRSEFGKAQKKVKRFTDGVKRAATSIGGIAAGAIGIRAGVAIFGDLADRFDRIGKLSNRFNLPTEDVQKLAVAAEVTGSGLEKMVAALTKATVSGVEAGQGLETYSRAFRQLNIDVEEFNDAAPDEKISILARAFSGAKDESVAFAAAYRILGKSGGDLIPLLRENADGIQRLTKGLKTLGADDVKAIEGFNDEMTVLKRNLQAEIAKEFAGELAGMKDEIKAVGQGIVNTVRFLIEYRGAIQGAVLAMAAFKGVKMVSELGAAVTIMIKTRLELNALSAATAAETVQVEANTAAHLKNASARGAGKGGGKLSKVVGVGSAVAVGVMIGKPIGDAIAKHMGRGFDEGFDGVNDPLNKSLSITAELVKGAKTQEETDRARVQIKEHIAQLEGMIHLNMGKQRMQMVQSTIETQKQRYAMADMLRERGLQEAVERKVAAEMDTQGERLEFQLKLQKQLEAGAERRAQKEAEIARELRGQVESLQRSVVDTQVDLLPPEERVKRFGDQLKKQLEDAVTHHNVDRRLDGKKEVGPANSIGDVYRMALRAQEEGDVKQAEILLKKVQEMQRIQAELKKAKDEVNLKEREQLELVKKQNEEKEKQREQQGKRDENGRQIAAEIAALKLEAQGRLKAAEALRKSVRLREEAKKIAEETGVSERQALEIARKRDALRVRAEKAKNPSGEGLRTRLRRERSERIQSKRADRAARAAAANGGGLGIGTGVVRQRMRDQRLTPRAPKDGALDKLDRMIGQQDELLNVWKNIVTSS